MVETKRVYITGDPNFDMIFQNLADRIDILEGLRPDLSAGLMEIEDDKDITTRTAGDMASQNSDSVEITGGSLTGVTISGNVSADNTEFDAISVNKITITDDNDEIIHQLGETE